MKKHSKGCHCCLMQKMHKEIISIIFKYDGRILESEKADVLCALSKAQTKISNIANTLCFEKGVGNNL